MKRINLVIFNEEYWNKGLIYSQNLLPLIKLRNSNGCEVKLISFTSLFKYISNYRKIKKSILQLKHEGVKVVNFPVLFYPTRYLLLRWFVLPFFYLNVFPYIKYLNYKDKFKNNNIYNLRSYQIALGFYKFYKNKDNLIFDLRTDWIEENINCGNFKKDSRTVHYWRTYEKNILKEFKKSIFISLPFLNSVLSRNGIDYNSNKHIIIYNPIDYSRFSAHAGKKELNFLYTGSLGHWNDIETYLDFFYLINNGFLNSKLIICTNTPLNKIESSLRKSKYDSIRDRVELHFDVPYDDLPEYYSRCSYGLQLMKKKDSRVGVKYIEYVAAGILPIVHENVMGAVQLIKDYDLGVVVNDSDLKDQENLIKKIHSSKPIDPESKKYLKFKEISDVGMISDQLIKIYEI